MDRQKLKGKLLGKVFHIQTEESYGKFNKLLRSVGIWWTDVPHTNFPVKVHKLYGVDSCVKIVNDCHIQHKDKDYWLDKGNVIYTMKHLKQFIELCRD